MQDPLPCEMADTDLEEAKSLVNAETVTQHLESKTRKTSSYNDFFEQPVEQELSPAILDAMTYKLGWLKAWGVFTVFKGTIWSFMPLWLIMGRLLIVCISFAILAYIGVPDPTLLDVSSLSSMNAVLSAFVTLMLSFFLSSSVHRWVTCVDGLFSMFNSVKNYSMQLHALGVEDEKIMLAMRYSVLSATFLIHDLRCSRLDEDKAKVATGLLWEHLLSKSSSHSNMDLAEIEILKHVDDKSAQMWVWVASHLGRMAKDGDVPPMASPTYGRLMSLVQAAQDGQRQTRVSVIVQLPVVYTHTLACLVHVNSLVYAVCTGIAVGTTLHGVHQYLVTNGLIVSHSENLAFKALPLTSLLQALVVALVKGFATPLLFQAFLLIGLSIVSPLDEESAAVPIGKLIHSLERDLQDARFLAARPPFWEIARFKEVKK